MSSSLVSSLRALSLRTKPASRVLPALCRHQPAVRFISQSALSATGAQRPAISTTVRAVVAQQTRGMKVHSSVKKRSCDGKPASDTEAISTSSAARTLDTNNAKASSSVGTAQCRRIVHDDHQTNQQEASYDEKRQGTTNHVTSQQPSELIAYVLRVGDSPMPLELGARKAARLGARGWVLDVPRAAQHGAVEREHTGALDELQRMNSARNYTIVVQIHSALGAAGSSWSHSFGQSGLAGGVPLAFRYG
ncbi:hypothetical protein GQX73_g6091 [Xylaria multiplex]|uniref:Uncharacterized protein n=1 Tax=Xylaria multiplex TaxID=323545 RepID=A0A7C8IZP8_9PEZI|nr:hypothetical protein GQX73_g6091 [Xylaria multiplex]